MNSWKLKQRPPADFLEKFPEFPDFVLNLLWNRGLKSQKEIDEFFNPDYKEDVGDPFLLKGIPEAVARIKSAVAKKEKIVIFGDYDADGVTSSAMLKIFLHDCGLESTVYIPDRVGREGHGLSEKKIRDFISEDFDLLITVDCGTSNFDEIQIAKDAGLETIIIDHHIAPEKIPPAVALINPKRADETYPFIHFSSAGLVFKLIQALMKEMSESLTNNGVKFVPGREKWFLDLVAISTVADWMPLLGENRTLVRYGLYVLAQTKRPGLKELMKIAGLKPIVNSKILKTNLNSESLAFAIVPRINAAGRMDHADVSLNLLTAENEEDIKNFIAKLEKNNNDRKEISGRVIDEVEKRISGYDELSSIIFEFSKDWPVGVLGIVSGRLAKKYQRPAFIGSEGEKEAIFSVRSVRDLNIVEVLRKTEHLFQHFGGHASAAGMTVSNELLAELEIKLRDVVETDFVKEEIDSPEIDYELKPEDIGWQLYDWLDRFEPFGEKNPKPVFLMKNLSVRDIRTMGGDSQHLRLVLEGGGKKFKAVGFGMGDWEKKLSSKMMESKIDAAFELVVNEWNGTRNLELKLIDIKLYE